MEYNYTFCLFYFFWVLATDIWCLLDRLFSVFTPTQTTNPSRYLVPNGYPLCQYATTEYVAGCGWALNSDRVAKVFREPEKNIDPQL